MKKKKILLVDDEAPIRRILSDRLKDSGYEVYEVIDGYEAIRSANELLPDLILLDLMIPRLEGSMVCKALKENAKTRKIPVIIFTAFGQDEAIKKVEDAGADKFITKPFSIKNLINTINEMLKG
jgi:DNA-binding response OmpR family regulator